jgi:hypothetical protein
MTHPLRAIPAAAALCLLASCGGGGGSPPDGGTPPVTASSGVAVDGYLQFATVLCDSNGNGVADAGERGAGTSATGAFSFSPACEAPLVVTGGTNADTGLPFTGQLRAPAGATVISPLTTLLAEGFPAADLAVALGLPGDTNLLTTDPAAATDGVLAQPLLYRKTLAVQQLVQAAAGVFARLAGQDSPAAAQALYARVARAVAAALAGAAPLSPGDTLDPAVVARLLDAAAREAAALYPFTDTIDPAALAQVMAEALALQAGRILTVDAAGLTAAVVAAQTSTQIGDFVIANAGALAAAPGEASAALAAALMSLVDPYVALAGDTIRLVNGSAATAYTLDQFRSDAGLSLPWPLAEPVVLEVTLANAANYMPQAGQKLSAAVSITETAAGGQGTILAYLDEVAVERVGTALRLTVPTAANAKVYGVSSDGSKKAVVDFRNSVRNVTGTFDANGAATRFPVGNIVNYAINQLSNDFTGIYSLRGRYRVSLVIAGLELRQADGTALAATSIDVPTAIGPNGAPTASRTISGRGLTGFVTLVD